MEIGNIISTTQRMKGYLMNHLNSPLGLFLVIISFLVLGQELAVEPISDADWLPVNSDGYAGTNSYNQLMNVEFHEGALYIGGKFSIAGNVYANNIVKWDGNNWHALGPGVNHHGVIPIRAFAFDSHGNMYAGGEFDSAGGVLAYFVAKWDGTQWSALGKGLNGIVYSVACDKAGNIYTAGDFTQAGGKAANGVAMWNGSEWSALGTGIYGGNAFSIAIDSSGNLFAVGSFHYAGGNSVKNIAKWSGGKWNSLADGLAEAATACVVDKSGNLFVGQGSLVCKWNGNEWDTLKSMTSDAGIKYDISVLRFDNSGILYAGGECSTCGTGRSVIAKWTGTQWDFLGSDFEDLVCDVGFGSTGRVFACGKFTKVGNITADFIAKFEDNTWKSLNSGMEYISRVKTLTTTPNGKLLIGGIIPTIGNIQVNNIALWDGTKWNAFNSGVEGAGNALSTYVTSTTCDKAENMYLAICKDERNVFTGSLNKINYVAKWNGSELQKLGKGMNYTIHSLACDSNGNLFAGGLFDSADGNYVGGIAHWNGTSWSAVGTGIVNGRIRALVFDSKNNMYAGGLIDSVRGYAGVNIAKWDGKNWSPTYSSGLLSKSYNGLGITALVTNSNDNLFATENIVNDLGGPYSIKNYFKCNILKFSKSSSFTTIGVLEGRLNETELVNALAIDDNEKLYIGGIFDTINGITANNIAIWDGNKWYSAGSGVDYEILALTVLDSFLYVGGSFDNAGGKFSPFIAKLNIHNNINSNISHFRPTKSVKNIHYHLAHNLLTISNITKDDVISIFSISGKCFRKVTGLSVISLKDVSPQPLIININNAGYNILVKIIILN